MAGPTELYRHHSNSIVCELSDVLESCLQLQVESNTHVGCSRDTVSLKLVIVFSECDSSFRELAIEHDSIVQRS